MKFDVVLPPGALRLTLAALVLASHYLPGVGFRAFLFDAVPVYGFFFLSGYWVARLWDDKYSRTRSPLFTFYVSRALRIYPLATASTLLAFGLVGGSWSQLASDIVLIKPAGLIGTGIINPPLWSLTIELQFYAIAPLVFLIRRNTAATVAVLTIGFAFWLIYASGVSRVHVFHFIFLFTLGARYSLYPWHAMANRLAPYSLAATAVLSTIANAPALISTMVEHELVRTVYVCVALLGLPYVAASVSKHSGSFDRWLGDLSFPLYVFHFPAIYVAQYWSGAPVSLAVAIAVILTLATNIAIDRPMESLRNKFVRRRLMTPDSRRANDLPLCTGEASPSN
jgi:peptidoglycan/LPS O-acetylase OafA/YrhL